MLKWARIPARSLREHSGDLSSPLNQSPSSRKLYDVSNGVVCAMLSNFVLLNPLLCLFLHGFPRFACSLTRSTHPANLVRHAEAAAPFHCPPTSRYRHLLTCNEGWLAKRPRTDGDA